MLNKQLLFAFRRLGRHKLNTTINILGLTLGVLSCLVIYLFINFEFSYDKFHPNGDRVYRVVANGKYGNSAGMTPPLAADLRRETTGFDIVTGFYVFDSRVIVPNAAGKAERTFAGVGPDELNHMAYAEPQFLQLFPYEWLAGSPKTALSAPFSVVLTEKEARRYFEGGDPQSWLGRTLVYHDSLTLSVTGIVADRKENSDVSFTDLVSYSTIEHSFLKEDIDGWNLWDGNAQAFVRLPKGTAPARAEKQFPAFLARHSRQSKKELPQLALQPLADIHFNAEYRDWYGRRAHKPTLYALAGIALFILLIASINFINLSTAQAAQRSREIGVRKVLGSSRFGLTSQFLLETSLIVFVAMALALLLANPVIHALGRFIPAGVHLDITSPASIGFIVLTAAITCLLAGWYPARMLSAFLPVLSLRGQGVQQLNTKSWLRKSLIVFQFTISLLFIIATMVVGRQTHYMLNTDLGFKKDAILTIDLPWNPKDKKEVFAAELSRLAGVQQISLASASPAAKGHSGTAIERAGATDIKLDIAGCDQVDPGYIPLYGITMLAGRNFFIADSARPESPGVTASRSFIINETAAKALGFTRPAAAIGQPVKTGFGGTVGPIIGVVKDYHSTSYHDKITPWFLTMTKGAGRLLSVKLNSNYRTPAQARELLTRVEASFKSIYPDTRFSARFFDETIQQLYQKEQKTAQIMNLSMAMAIFISCMGLFGLAAFTASQRTREIGIRKVLGAGVPHLVSMLSKDFVVLVGLATLIAAPIAGWAMHQWLQDFAYHISIPWWIYAGAGLAAIVIALVTVSFQAIRAATANPVDSLKAE
jgi:ABC-type antimicrobial peptide transport system permease subunit